MPRPTLTTGISLNTSPYILGTIASASLYLICVLTRQFTARTRLTSLLKMNTPLYHILSTIVTVQWNSSYSVQRIQRDARGSCSNQAQPMSGYWRGATEEGTRSEIPLQMTSRKPISWTSLRIRDGKETMKPQRLPPIAYSRQAAPAAPLWAGTRTREWPRTTNLLRAWVLSPAPCHHLQRWRRHSMQKLGELEWSAHSHARMHPPIWTVPSHDICGGSGRPCEKLDDLPSGHVLLMHAVPVLLLKIILLHPVWAVCDLYVGHMDKKTRNHLQASSIMACIRGYDGLLWFIQATTCIPFYVKEDERGARWFMNALGHARTSTAATAPKPNLCPDCCVAILLERKIISTDDRSLSPSRKSFERPGYDCTWIYTLYRNTATNSMTN